MIGVNPDFVAGFDAAAKSKTMIIEALERKNLRFLLLLSLAKEEIEAFQDQVSMMTANNIHVPPSNFLAEVKRLHTTTDDAAEIARQMAVAENVMDKDYALLAELAKR